MNDKKLVNYLPEFIEEFTKQLESDEKRWGNTWQKRGIKGQERRTFERFRDYWDCFKNNNVSIPWMKIIGGAFICWLRERHPEFVENPDNDCKSIDL